MTTTPKAQPHGVEQSLAASQWRHVDFAGSLDGRELSVDNTGNMAFNALLIGRILALLGTFAEPAGPLRLLDAGCGTGWATRALASFGHQVDGIDSAAAVVAACRRHARVDGRDRYFVSRLDIWSPAYLYDAVVSVDVVSRILADSLWEASVVNLAALVRSGGRLILSDHDLAEDHSWSPSKMTRARRRYVDLLGAEGFVHRRFLPFDFRYNTAGFHVFDRIA